MSRNCMYGVLKRSVSSVNHNIVNIQVRLYSRWMHRKPARVILPFEPSAKAHLKQEKIIDLGSSALNVPKDNQVHIQESKLHKVEPSLSSEKIREIKQNKEIRLKQKNLYLSQKKVFDENNEIMYEKVNGNDGRVSTLLVKLKSKKERQRTQQMLVEGWRLIVDGLEAKCTLKYIFFSRLDDLNKLRAFLPKTGVQIYKVSYKELELWSDVETSSGIFGVFEMPSVDNIARKSKPIPLQIICDNVRVPGNLGGILRAAVGAGCENLLLTKGCVDLWDPKVIRSAAGAHFRQPIHTSLDWQQIPKLLSNNTSIFIADSNAKVNDDPENRYSEDIESHYNMPVVPYYSVNFAESEHITLIIGGETEGISTDSYRLAQSKNGVRLNIPLQRGVDSLNTGMAVAVIAFEIRKQYMQYWTKLKFEKQAIPAT